MSACAVSSPERSTSAAKASACAKSPISRLKRWPASKRSPSKAACRLAESARASPNPCAAPLPANTSASPSAPLSISSCAWALKSAGEGWSRRDSAFHGPGAPRKARAPTRPACNGPSLMASAVTQVSLSSAAPFSAASAALRHSASERAGNGDCVKRLASDELRQAGDRRRDLADQFVAGLLARVGEHLAADLLHLIHRKAEIHEVAAERHQSAAAHRAGAGAHQAAQRRAEPFAAGRGGGDDGAQRRRLIEQCVHRFLRRLAPEEVEDQRDRLARDVRRDAGARGHVSDEMFHACAPRTKAAARPTAARISP